MIEKAIIAENSVIGENAVLGEGEEVPNKMKPNVYSFGLVTIGEGTVVPPRVYHWKEYGSFRKDSSGRLSRRRSGQRRNFD